MYNQKIIHIIQYSTSNTMKTRFKNSPSGRSADSLDCKTPSYAPKKVQALIEKINKEQETALQVNRERRREFNSKHSSL